MLVELFLCFYLLLMFSVLRYASQKINEDKLTYFLYYGNKKAKYPYNLNYENNKIRRH